MRERSIMLVVWTVVVSIVIWLGAGFGGGLEKSLADNLPALLFALSPVIPLILWFKAVRDSRQNP